MIGILYRNSDKVILNIAPDVQSITETDIIGETVSLKGIDLSQVSFCIVESTELNEGDVLGEFTDVRSQLPKTPDQLRIEELEAQLSVMNTNNIEFMEMILQTLGVE